MQQDHEPIARRAGDRGREARGLRPRGQRIPAGGPRAGHGVDHRGARTCSTTAMTVVLREQSDARPSRRPRPSCGSRIAGHVARGQALAEQAAQRADWVARRHASLDELAEARDFRRWRGRAHRSGPGVRAAFAGRADDRGQCAARLRRHGLRRPRREGIRRRALAARRGAGAFARAARGSTWCARTSTDAVRLRTLDREIRRDQWRRAPRVPRRRRRADRRSRRKNCRRRHGAAC